MEKYFIQEVPIYECIRVYSYRSHKYEYILREKYGNHYIVLHNYKISNLKLIYPPGGSWGLCCDDYYMSSNGKKFMKLVVVNKNNTTYPTFSIDNSGIIHEVSVYVDCKFIGRDPYNDSILRVTVNCIPILTNESITTSIILNYKYVKGRAFSLTKLFRGRLRDMDLSPELHDKVFDSHQSIYSFLCKYYTNCIETGSESNINQCIKAFINNKITRERNKRQNIPTGLIRYFPVDIKRNMVKFDGGVKSFDIARVSIPLVNPDRGKISLVHIVKKYKKEIFTRVYDKLEELSGIPRGFFKLDNCTLTHDECLSFIFSLKECPTEEKEA